MKGYMLCVSSNLTKFQEFFLELRIFCKKISSKCKKFCIEKLRKKQFLMNFEGTYLNPDHVIFCTEFWIELQRHPRHYVLQILHPDKVFQRPQLSDCLKMASYHKIHQSFWKRIPSVHNVSNCLVDTEHPNFHAKPKLFSQFWGVFLWVVQAKTWKFSSLLLDWLKELFVSVWYAINAFVHLWFL